MNALKTLWRHGVGLFVDDEFLALGILAVVALAAIAMKISANSTAAEVALLGGCVAVLVAGVWRSARPRRS